MRRRWARRWALGTQVGRQVGTQRQTETGTQVEVDKATSAQRDINTGPSISNWHLTGRYLPWQVHYLYLPDSKLCVICQ